MLRCRKGRINGEDQDNGEEHKNGSDYWHSQKAWILKQHFCNENCKASQPAIKKMLSLVGQAIHTMSSGHKVL